MAYRTQQQRRDEIDEVHEALAKASDTDVARWLGDLDADALMKFRSRLYSYSAMVNAELRERNNYRSVVNSGRG